MKRFLWIAVLAVLLLLGAGALAEEMPLLKLEYVPPYGATNLSYVCGRAYNDSGAPIDPDAYVVSAYVVNEWGQYAKPYWEKPTTHLKADGSFEVLTYTASPDKDITDIRILLIPAAPGISTEYRTDHGRAVDEIFITRYEDGTASWDRSNGRSPVNEPKTRLRWSDEFYGTAVDSTRWRFETGNWITDANGNLLSLGWGNNEAEYYLARNATVGGGLLTITARKEAVTDPKQGAFAYTSARMNTKGQFATTYGRIEARIRCDLGETLWPAFWLLPADAGAGWPKTGEMDVWEGKGSVPSAFWNTMHFYNQGNAMIGNYGAGRYADGGTFAGWHTYAVEWTAGLMHWYVDGQLTFHAADWAPSNVTYPGPFDKPFYLLLNLAVGGRFATGNNENTFVDGPRKMEVDYVRVYDLAAQGAVPPNTVSLADTALLLTVDGQKTLAVQAGPVNGVTWASANPAVATVDENGTVTGIGKGTTVITVTDYAGNTATCNVRVCEAVGNGGQVTDGASFVAALGGTEVATLTGSAAEGWTVTLTRDTTLLAKITLVSGNYTLVSDGTAHTLDRGPGHTLSMFAVGAGASLTLGAPGAAADASPLLLLDGGALWGEDFANTGLTTASPLLMGNGLLTVNGGVTICNCDCTVSGAAICVAGTDAPVIHGGVFRDNRSAQRGGTLYVQQADLTITGGTFSGNRAKYGGALYMECPNQNATIRDAVFRGNSAIDSGSSGDGGALYLAYPTASLTGVTCENNHAGGSGGAIYTKYEGLTLTDTALTGNTVASADGRGSAVSAYWYNGMTAYYTLDGVTCTANSGGREAIYANRCELRGALRFSTDNVLYMITPATLATGLTIDGSISLRLPAYELGQPVLLGEAVPALHGRFTLPAADTGYVVGPLGRLDTASGSLVTNGAEFVARLGGTGNAGFTGDAASGYTVTLTANVALSAPVVLVSGRYTLTSDGVTRTITRAASHTGRLIAVGSDAALSLGGGGAATLVLDGGAVWNAGNENTGITASAPLVFAEGTLSVHAGVELRNCDSTADGAAIYHCAGDAFTMDGGLFENNRSAGGGGAVYVRVGDTQITGGIFRGNRARQGGALYTYGADRTATLSDVLFSGNAATGADGCGGAYYSEVCAPVLTNVTCTGNRATLSGGALYSRYIGFRLNGCTLNSNAVTAVNAKGSALYCDYVTVWGSEVTTLNGVTVSGNTGATDAVYTSGCVLGGNVSFAPGDGLYAGSLITANDGVSLTDTLDVRFSVYEVGRTMVGGSEGAVAAISAMLRLPAPFCVRASGRLDTEPPSLITDGVTLVAALGGTDAATCTGDAARGWRISLKSDVALAMPLSIQAGRYTLVSYGTARTLRRAAGYTGPLVVVAQGAAFTLGEPTATPNTAIRLVLDGGASSGVNGASPLVLTHGTLTINGGVQLCNNTCADLGGAVYSDGPLTVNGGLFSGNRASNGGAIYCTRSPLMLRGGTLRGNTATGSGGAICTYFQAGLTATGGTFIGNSASAGGALSLNCGGNTLSDVRFSGNTATQKGGALYTDYENISLTRCGFIGNSLTGSGLDCEGAAVFYGAIEAVPIRLSSCQLTRNGAVGSAVHAALLSVGGAMRCNTADDTLFSPAPIRVHETLTGLTRVALQAPESGQVVLTGADGHALTPEEVAAVTLTRVAGGSLVLNAAANRAVLTYETTVSIEAKAASQPVYCGDAVPPQAGVAFTVRVLLTQDGHSTDISDRYNIGGTDAGKLGVTYRHAAVKEGEPVWAEGFPTETGAWQVLVQITADNENGLAGGTARFTLRLYDPLDISADGTVDIGDIVAIARHVKRLTKLTGTQLAQADVNRDHAVDVRDELILADRLVGAFDIGAGNGSDCLFTVTPAVNCARVGDTLAIPIVGAGKDMPVGVLALAVACPTGTTLQSSIFGPVVTHDTIGSFTPAKLAGGFAFTRYDDAAQALRILFVNAGVSSARKTKATLGTLAFTVPTADVGTGFAFRVTGVSGCDPLGRAVGGLGTVAAGATVTVGEQELVLTPGSEWLPKGDGLALNPRSAATLQASLRFAVNRKTTVNPRWSIDEGPDAVRILPGSNGKLTVTAIGTGHVILRATAMELEETFAFDIVPAAAQIGIDATVNGSPAAIVDHALTVQAGDTVLLTATAQPDGALPLVTWESDNHGVLTVDVGGAVTLCHVGRASVTATACDANHQTGAVQISVEARATGLAFSDEVYRIAVGASRRLNPTVTPREAADHLALAWAIEDETVASVDGNGLVTGLLPGRTALTATADGLTASCEVAVYQAAKSLTLDAASVWLPRGQSRTLVATLSPDTADDAGLVWNTSNQEVATVADGVVTAQDAGKAQITVQTEDGALCASCIVTVAPAEAEGLRIQPQGSTQLGIGASLRLVALDASDAPVPDAVWYVNQTKYAKILPQTDGSCMVKAGTTACTVTVYAVTETGAASLTLTIGKSALAVKMPNAVSLRVGASQQLQATVTPAGVDKTLIWASDRPQVATVTQNGLVTAVGSGTARITATAPSGVNAVCVVAASRLTTGIQLRLTDADGFDLPTDAALPIYMGESCHVKALALGEPDNPALVWKLSPASLATLSGDTLTIIRNGNLTLTVTAQDGSGISRSLIFKALKPATGLKLNKTAAAITMNPSAQASTLQLTATGLPTGAGWKKLRWSVSGDAVTVSQSGLVTAEKSGVATVTATTDSGASGRCTVTVASYPQRMTFAEAAMELLPGEVFDLGATLRFDDYATLKKATWKTDNRIVALVSTGGIVSAKSLGDAIITATSANGLTAVCMVHVVSVKTVDGAAVDAPAAPEESPAQLEIAEELPAPELTPEPTETPAPGEPIAPIRLSLPELPCSISDDRIVQVAEGGRVIPLTAGVVQLACEGAQLTLRVDETPRITGIQARLGDRFTLLGDIDAQWVSQDETVARVENDGSVCLYTVGEAVLALTRADETVVETIRLTVIEIPLPTDTPEPTLSPEPTETPAITGLPLPSNTPEVSPSAEPTTEPPTVPPETPQPTKPEQPTAQPTLAPAATPMPEPPAPPSDEADANGD